MPIGPLAVAAIGLLLERPMHPYEMHQLLLARSEDRLVKVRPGSLYHAIDRLNEEGLVRALGTQREGNRPERTTYEVTPAGVAAMHDWVRSCLREPVNEYPRFPLALGEAHNLPGAEVAVLLEERLAALRADDRLLADSKARVASQEVDERYWVDVPYLRALLAAEIDWLERLVTRLRSGTIVWPDPAGPSRNGDS
jgi:DNA-binding PadR family transcriptional regulator